MSEYKMPPISGGCPILFYPGANRSLPPQFGFVSRVGRHNLLCHVLSEESHNFLIRDGVRHVDDPGLKTNPHAREDGAWDYHPLHRAVMELQAKVEELCSNLGVPTKVG